MKRVAVLTSGGTLRERDYTIRRDDGDIVRPDLGILVELAPHGVM